MAQIHPTAVVDPRASLGQGVEIGPFCVVEAGAVIGDRCRLEARSTVKTGVTLGAGNEVGEGAVLGGRAQHLANQGPGGSLIVGQGNKFRENVTVHRGFADGAATIIGDHNLIMVNAHIAHDCRIGNHVVIVNNVMLGGHVSIGDRAYLGGASAMHQHCRVGQFAMVGGMARCTRDVPPYVLIDGETTEVVGLNKVGLRRNGFSPEDLLQLKQAYRVIYRDGLRWTEVLAALQRDFAAGPAAAFLEFLQTGRRGFVQERRISRKATLKLVTMDGAEGVDEDRVREAA